MDLFIEVASIIKNKGEYTSLMDELIKAIEGVGEIDDEVKEAFFVSVKTIMDKAVDLADVFVDSPFAGVVEEKVAE